jgi:hypothetical protein
MSKPTCLTLVAAAALAAALHVGPGIAEAVSTYNFETQAPGTATPFSVADTGVTASFSSPADPGGFTIAPTFFSTLPGQVLLDPGPAGADNIPLTMGFSQPIASITLLFALNTQVTAVPLNLSTSAGGSASATGAVPAGFAFPEGSLSFTGAPFTSVVLSSPAFDFAIDNVVVTPAVPGVPEPGTLSLVAVGLVALGVVRRRKHS